MRALTTALSVICFGCRSRQIFVQEWGILRRCAILSFELCCHSPKAPYDLKPATPYVFFDRRFREWASLWAGASFNLEAAALDDQSALQLYIRLLSELQLHSYSALK